MSLKRLYYDKNYKVCLTCKFIDEYAFNVNDEGEIPHGYDGMALCCIFDENDKESFGMNDGIVSPVWRACKKYEKCTERQADYLDIFDNNEIIKNPNYDGERKI